MEGEVSRSAVLDIALMGGGVKPVDQRPKVWQFVALQGIPAFAQGPWFEHCPQSRNVIDGALADLGDKCPNKGNLEDQALFLEAAKRLAQGRSTDPEFSGDLCFTQFGAGRQGAIKNCLAQSVGNRVGCRSLLEFGESHRVLPPNRSPTVKAT